VLLALYGWTGKLIRVDLTKGLVKVERIPKRWLVSLLGSAGINAKILYDEVGPEVDPFDPENRLIFGFGPLCGTLAPSSSRYTITTKGPMTFGFSDSNSGGHFGPEVRFAGYDNIVFQGASSKPVYLWIYDDQVELRDAAHLWGKDTWETEEIIRHDLGDPDVKMALIGPSGENLIRNSAVINDHARAAGWGGVGSVMGSKRLKGVAVRGTKGLKIADHETFLKKCEEYIEQVIKSPRMKTVGYYGKPWLNWLRNEVQRSNPVKNYQLPRVPSEEFPKVGLDAFKDVIVKWKSCFNCPFHCSHIVKARAGPYVGEMGEGFEYNQMIDGQMMGIYDLNFVVKWTNETNKLGIDCDGPAYAIAWAMELYEKGILTKRDLDGIDLRWGNQEIAFQMLDKIVKREGIGDLLAEGIEIAAKKIGRGSEKYAYHIKGCRLEIDPRTGWGTALSHATSTRGADHLKGTPLSNAFGRWKNIPYDFTDDSQIDYKAEAVIFFENLNAVVDSIGLCKNDTWTQSAECPGLYEFAEMLTAATGVPFTAQQLLTSGERTYNIERAFNSKSNLTRDNDCIPEKFFTDPIETKLRVLDHDRFEKLKDTYYHLRGWDVATGHPTPKKLKELGLSYIAKDMEKYIPKSRGMSDGSR
jgi:aldehyde:ferredoxin oxidoreductase